MQILQSAAIVRCDVARSKSQKQFNYTIEPTIDGIVQEAFPGAGKPFTALPHDGPMTIKLFIVLNHNVLLWSRRRRCHDSHISDTIYSNLLYICHHNHWQLKILNQSCCSMTEIQRFLRYL